MATTTFSGPVVSTNGFTGAITGDITGNVTGNLTGDVTGDVTGNLTGNVTGDVTGNVTGNLTGNVTGNVTGDVTGDVVGAIQVPTYTVAGAPAATSIAGTVIYVSDGAAGSPVLAFSDGTNWLRCDTLATISGA